MKKEMTYQVLMSVITFLNGACGLAQEAQDVKTKPSSTIGPAEHSLLTSKQGKVSLETYQHASSAITPPMGWNSSYNWGWNINEQQVKANADYMHVHLKKYGWKYIVIDWSWYRTSDAADTFIDEYGRVLPVVDRYPSAEGGCASARVGFKPLADYIHEKGLKFGIHIMCAISEKAVQQNTPILGTSYHAADIANANAACNWGLGSWHGIDMSKPGAQAYLDSLFQQYAAWGVDFVKIDNLGGKTTLVQAYRHAIDHCGRDMVFSISPNGTRTNDTVSQDCATMWRIVGDVYDNWPQLNQAFDAFKEWAPYLDRSGHWPDLDMIPIGYLYQHSNWCCSPSRNGPRWCALTQDEQYSLMSLLLITRAPLMLGANLPDSDPFTLSLITNAETLAVNQNSHGNRLVQHGDYPIWAADVPDSSDKYLAIFNRTSACAQVLVNLNNFGMKKCAIRNLWTKADMGTCTDTFAPTINAHGAGLYKLNMLTQCDSKK